METMDYTSIIKDLKAQTRREKQYKKQQNNNTMSTETKTAAAQSAPSEQTTFGDSTEYNARQEANPMHEKQRAPLEANADVPWSLADRDPVAVNNDKGNTVIRILWSANLALELKRQFNSKEDAQKVIDQIVLNGKIRPEGAWKKLFKPSADLMVDGALEASSVDF